MLTETQVSHLRSAVRRLNDVVNFAQTAIEQACLVSGKRADKNLAEAADHFRAARPFDATFHVEVLAWSSTEWMPWGLFARDLHSYGAAPEWVAGERDAQRACLEQLRSIRTKTERFIAESIPDWRTQAKISGGRVRGNRATFLRYADRSDFVRFLNGYEIPFEHAFKRPRGAADLEVFTVKDALP